MGNNYKKDLKQSKAEAEKYMNSSQLTKCKVAIHTAATASAAAGATPIILLAGSIVSVAQISMILTIGKVFEQKITASAAKDLLSAAISPYLSRNIFEFIPVAGLAVSTTIAAGITEAVGWKIAVDFVKQAKLDWDKDHNPNNEKNDFSQEIVSEQNEIDDIIRGLPERTEPFLNHKKTISTDEDEYNALIYDYEKLLDFLKDEDPLKKHYDALCLLGI